jgi:hypothetical protein
LAGDECPDRPEKDMTPEIKRISEYGEYMPSPLSGAILLQVRL